MFDLNEMNIRQESIVPDMSEEVAVVVGVGGIGAWVALDVALIGYKTIYLFDDDIVEMSNLNRTPFKISHIGLPKVDATTELIDERRPEAIVICNKKYIDDEDIAVLPKKADIYDCTDNLSQRSLFKDKGFNNYIKFGYDGFGMTLISNDFESGTWGDESSYTIIPSFFGSPQIISAIGVIEVLKYKKDPIPRIAKTISFNASEILDNQETLEAFKWEKYKEKK